jgi:hypothetical protein
MILLQTSFNRALRLVCVFFCTFFALTSSALFAQSYSNPVATGLGGVGVITASDVDAIASNPALMIPQTQLSTATTLTFTLGAVGGIAGASAFKLSELPAYFGKVSGNRRVLTDAELRQAASLLNGSRAGVQADATLLAAVLQTNIGAFAVSASLHSEAGVRLPRGLAQALQGYNAAERLRLEGLGGNGFGYGNLQLGYANHIVLPEMADSTNTLASLRVGGTLQYLAGYALEEISAVNLELSPIPITDFPTTSYNIRANLDYTLRSAGTALLTRGQIPTNPLAFLNASGGTGFGAGFGAVAGLRLPGSKVAAWHIGFSLTNIGGITWNAARFSAVTFQDTIKSILTIATDSTYLQRLRDTASRPEAISRSLPTRLNIGFAFDYGSYFGLTTPLVLSLQYTQGLNESGFNTTLPRFTLGFAWENTGYVPSLRTGIAVGGQEEIVWSCGLGWNIANSFMIDVAVANLLPLLSGGNGTWLGGSLRLKGRIGW